MAKETKIIETSDMYKVAAGSPAPYLYDSSHSTICFGESGPLGVVSETGKANGSKTAKINSAADLLYDMSLGISVKIGVSSTNENILCLERGADSLCVIDLAAKTASYYGTSAAHEAAYPFVALAAAKCPEFKTWAKKFYGDDCVYAIDPNLAFVFCDMVYYFAKTESVSKFSKRTFTSKELDQLNKTTEFINLSYPLLNERIIECNPVSPEFSLVNTFVEGRSSATSAVSSFDAEMFGDEVLSGKYIVEFDWGTNKRYIPDIMKTTYHVFTEVEANLINEFHTIMCAGKESFARGDVEVFRKYSDKLNTLFYGAASGGKTEAVEMVAAALQVPLGRVTGSPHMEESAFQGMTIVKDGHLTSDPGIFLNFFKNGGFVVIEEFNIIPPGVLQGALSQALVPPYTMTAFNVETISRHPMCMIFATMNPGYAGTRLQNSAFMSRFGHKYKFMEMSKELFLAILQRNGVSDDNALKTYKAYSSIRDYLSEDEDNHLLRDECSFRQAMAMAYDLERGCTIAEAAEHTLIAAIEVSNEKIAEEVRGLITAV